MADYKTLIAFGLEKLNSAGEKNKNILMNKLRSLVRYKWGKHNDSEKGEIVAKLLKIRGNPKDSELVEFADITLSKLNLDKFEDKIKGLASRAQIIGGEEIRNFIESAGSM